MTENTTESVSIADAAAECGVTVSTFISWEVDAGMLLELPDCLDPRCQPMFPGGIRWHVEGCECRLIPVPHPDLVERGR